MSDNGTMLNTFNLKDSKLSLRPFTNFMTCYVVTFFLILFITSQVQDGYGTQVQEGIGRSIKISSYIILRLV